MAQYHDAVCRHCRREGVKLFLKGEKCFTKCTLDRRAMPPGMHTQVRRRKVSDYGIQLRAKQRARRIYFLLEGQFRLYFDRAAKMAGVTGLNLLRLLETRLDNVVYRVGFAASRRDARQLVSHGHLTVNGRPVNIPSYAVRVGDVIAIKDSSKEVARIKNALDAGEQRPVGAWLSLDKENVTEIILNLKGLNLISYSDDPVRLTLDVTGPREVKAADIQAPSDVEIVNPELYICTLDSNKGRLRMELTVERGKGYVPAERNKKEGQPIGVIPIDAIFSPVVKANFLIEKTRVGQETDWDKLILEVWTDGTIQPDQAISEAAKQFTSHLGLFTRFTERIKDADVPPQKGNDLSSRLADVPIEDLDLSVRALNCLKANEITKVGQLVALREEDLLSLRNFGRKSLDEIKEKLVQRGFLTPDELTKVLV